jgi:hypothetical protein
VPRRRRVVVPLLLAAALGAACDRGADVAAAGWRPETDTIGDTLVVRTVGVDDAAAALRLEPELRIGELEGADEYQFAGVSFVLPAPANGVYVWDHTLTALRQYDSAGTFVRTIGGKGGGPGEYEAANGIVRLRDGRLVLWDPRNTRFTVYDSAGTVTASWRFESGLHVGGFGGLLADTADNLYAMHWFRSPDTTKQELPGERSGYMVVGLDGAVKDSVLPPALDVPRAQIVASREGGTSSNSVPFAPQRAWTISPHGYVVSGVGNRYAVTLHRPGAPLRIEREVAALPVDADEKANAEEIAIANMRRTDPSWRWNGPPIPDVKPLLRSIRAGADGRLWVQRSQPGEAVEPDPAPEQGDPRDRMPPRRWREPTAYDVYEPDGRYVGFLRLPPRTQLTHMHGERVWGVEADSLDVPYVVRFRLLPPAAAAAGDGR